jgi:hypothetical protein
MTDASARPIRYLAVSEDDADDDSGQQSSSGGGGGLHYVEIGCYLDFRAGGQTRWVLERTVVTVPRSSDAGHALGDAVDSYVATMISDRAFAFRTDGGSCAIRAGSALTTQRSSARRTGCTSYCSAIAPRKSARR